MKTPRKASPARSQGPVRTPIRHKPRRTLSVTSARSSASVIISALTQQRKDNASFTVSPLGIRKSILSDNTEIEEPRRKSWWKNLGENSTTSRDMDMELVEENVNLEPNNLIEELDMEIVSQENKKNYTLELPESSDSESIISIVITQRKLFPQREYHEKHFAEIVGSRESLAKRNETVIDKTLVTGTRELFQNKQRTKPIFPAALLNISHNQTAAEKTPKAQVRNIFGQRDTKRKNIFTNFNNFIVTESEDEIPDIQPKVFGFRKTIEASRCSSLRGIREPSPAPSITTDMEMDDWKMLPSSTMVENQIEVLMTGQTPKSYKNIESNHKQSLHASGNDLGRADNVQLEQRSMNKSQVHNENDTEQNESQVQNESIIEDESQNAEEDNDEEQEEQDLDAEQNESDIQDDAEVKESQVQNENDIEQNESQEEDNEEEQEEQDLDAEQNESDIQDDAELNESQVQNENDIEQNESQEKVNEEEQEEQDFDAEQNESDIQDDAELNESQVQNENDIEQNESQEKVNEEEQEEQDLDAEQNESDIQDDAELNESQVQNENDIEQNESQEEDNDEEQEEQDLDAEQNESDIQDDAELNESQVQNENDIEQNESQEEDNDEEQDLDDEQNESDIQDQNLEDSPDKGVDSENQEESAVDEIMGTPNVSHDTTGRNRKKNKSPEAVLHESRNLVDSLYSVKGDKTVRKTEILKSTHRDLVPARESAGFSDGSTSSAQGSGWDSHRTTRKTLRQTYGRDFTPRKSLRALVMEKSAKRQTQHNEMASVTGSLFPQANSTEIPSNHYEDEDENENTPPNDISLRTRQTTIEKYLMDVAKVNAERRMKIEEKVLNSLKEPPTNNIFKIPATPLFARNAASKAKQSKTAMRAAKITKLFGGELPPALLKDLMYKPPKRFQPKDAPWATKHLYKFFESKLEPKYKYKSRVRAERLMEKLYNFTKELRRRTVAALDAVEDLKLEMARLRIVKTHHEFYEFFGKFMPRDVRRKVMPDLINNIELPRQGVFSDIL